METDYLKRCFGNSLTQALAEVATVRPSDPIEYLAHWLYHHRKNTKMKEEPPVAVASDTDCNTFVQENTEPPGKETSMQEFLPSTSSVIPEAPPEMPSPGLHHQNDCDIRTLQEKNDQTFPSKSTHEMDSISKYPS